MAQALTRASTPPPVRSEPKMRLPWPLSVYQTGVVGVAAVEVEGLDVRGPAAPRKPGQHNDRWIPTYPRGP